MAKAQGLYRPEFEHDSCGIGFVANLKNKKSYQTIQSALDMLVNMEHRGGCGCEPDSGDGAGILMQVPDSFFQEECKKLGFDLPEFGKYGVAMTFFPSEDDLRAEVKSRFEEYITRLGFELIGYREVPTDNSMLGKTSVSVEPRIEQVFLRFTKSDDKAALERRLVVLRKYAIRTIRGEMDGVDDFYIASCSYKVVVYKGMLRTDQVQKYFLDLQNEDMKSALAVVHSRFSTNTFPKWRLAQPFRYIAHNGEINTIKGNVNWMKSKQVLLESTKFTLEEIDWMMPICDISRSDSSNLDNVVELLTLDGRSMAEVMMMMVPEAWQNNPLMREEKRAFYEYYSSIMEPWDGPASISFTDGEIVGATLDRNGLRPSRYCVLDDDTVIMASEAGALIVDESKVISKGRLQPGKLFIADLNKGRIVSDEEIKDDICARQPFGRWLKENKLSLKDIARPRTKSNIPHQGEDLLQQQIAFGFTREDLSEILEPMTKEGKEPLGSMGVDTPLAVLSSQAQHVSNYFKQLFAQVSNPPIDPIREAVIMSLNTALGGQKNILTETPEHCRQIHLDSPVLSNGQLDKIKSLNDDSFKSYTIHAVFSSQNRPGSLERAIDEICANAERAALMGCNVLIISNKEISAADCPIPSLLAVGAIHSSLIAKGLRTRTSLVVEGGDIIETHHYATLIGFGATAINAYLAGDTIRSIYKEDIKKGKINIKNVLGMYAKSINSGLLKIFSKMGISTVQSYQGAQIFEALGIADDVIAKCFEGTVSRIQGMNFDMLARETIVKHQRAFENWNSDKHLFTGGYYQWKRKGEAHLFNPTTIHLLQKSSRNNDFGVYKQYAEAINNQYKQHITLRSLLEFKKGTPVSLEEVESKESIMKRFATGAMSFGSISHEAHSTLAIAMNRIGGKSNSGEGGEDEARFEKKANGDWERSAIKQVASGRFGVTSNYLTNAEELQIKVAQGAKPGEGGQLPGHKVDDWIGRVRHSTPGVGLISPPPHHDIYSIEDLAQLIFDLKNANRKARINVKLVSEAGVGTIATGVAKAKGDVVLIAGYDGGTGASPLSSIRHAGLPWELGLAETHQTLVLNDLRSRITVQTDGQIRTGRDVAIAALLGAEEWGVATAALVVEGCIMMRKCHLNTCPVGIATQNKELRALFSGNPDHVVNFFNFLAEDLREVMAELGFKTINEMIGRVDKLEIDKNLNHWKLKNVDLSPLLYRPKEADTVGVYRTREQEHEITDILDRKFIEKAQPALTKGEAVKMEFDILNIDRSAGAMLSNEISKVYGGKGLPDGTINIKLKGSCGQSFAVFTAKGIRFEVEGEANDYFGKGLSGGEIIIYPPKISKFVAEENMIIGNVAFYGATSGKSFIRGLAGERFCVRNSGVTAVVEGIGDHGCEYMTGGRVVILGETGRNFGAGMSGGYAYVWDKKDTFLDNFNPELSEIETLSSEDETELKGLIQEHFDLTGSQVAERILDKWYKELKNFKKIMPRDFKRVMLEKEAKAKTESIA
ncbi:MAG: glutamate synthase (NADPH/NADH) large chain [Saprospiraceae bacterium]|jgi:glutamate synthase (NADPH/NADH) large chain